MVSTITDVRLRHESVEKYMSEMIDNPHEDIKRRKNLDTDGVTRLSIMRIARVSNDN